MCSGLLAITQSIVSVVCGIFLFSSVCKSVCTVCVQVHVCVASVVTDTVFMNTMR